MTDTVQKLMALADAYAEWTLAEGNEHPTYARTRQALEAELTRLFTPLSEGTMARYLREVDPDIREDLCAYSFCEGARFAEKHRGITGETK